MTGDEKKTSVAATLKLPKKVTSNGEEILNIRKKGESALKNPVDQNLFIGMMSILDSLYKDFISGYEEAEDSANTASETVFPAESDKAFKERVKRAFYEAKGFHAQLINKQRVPQNQSNSELNANVTSGSSRAILPKIQIKAFSGSNLADWPLFRQMFNALIVEEESLTDSERFHYLLSYLDGAALDTIKHIQVVEENFDQAWTALNLVYDDKRKLAASYLENFLSFKQIPGKPTCDSLHKYLSTVTESITSLQNLNIPNFSDYLLFELALKSLDPVTREAFELSIVGTGVTYPSFNSLQEFVRNRCHVLRLTQPNNASEQSSNSKPSTNQKTPRHPNRFAPQKTTSTALAATNESAPTKASSTGKTCFVCQGSHRLLECQKFTAATPTERVNMLRNWTGCRNCLHPFHKTRECKSTHKCRECQQAHSTFLHLPPKEIASSSPPQPSVHHIKPPSAPQTSTSFTGASTSHHSTHYVLLGTVTAYLRNNQGMCHPFRGVLDPGSQHSFITEECARALGRSTRAFKTSITGVNGSQLGGVRGQVTIQLENCSGSKTFETEAVVVRTITPPLPQTQLNSDMWEDYKSYQLSDPNFHEPGPIFFLIGADLYPDVITGAPIVLYEQGPRLINTVFGFAVLGKITHHSSAAKHLALLSLSELSSQISRFWEVEEALPTPSGLSPEEHQCEEHYKNTFRRAPDGRYILRLPFRTGTAPQLKPDYKRALGRLRSIEAKLAKNEKLRIAYHEFMKEYESLGHMTPTTKSPMYVIPHHPVVKEDVNGNLKLRIVFNASSTTETGSLNDHLLIGPKLQGDTRLIMLHFRRFEFVLTCDAAKMFRQIRIDEADQPYLTILWREKPEEEPRLFQLETVTYGISPAPFQAERTLLQLIEDEGDAYPIAAEALKHNRYVDDVAYGANSIEELFELKYQLIDLMAKAGFTLGKWSSNYTPLLDHQVEGTTLIDLDEESNVTKILGMQWNPKTDCFTYKVAEPDQAKTKREILSIIARLFDPLGYLAPVTFYAKRVLQEIWKSKLDWDDDIPEHLLTSWQQFSLELPVLATINIHRPFPKSDTYQLVCFSDASERGYCGVAYLRSAQGDLSTMTLLMSKTRVAPLKTLTVPRLELCGALLLSEIIELLTPIINAVNISEVYCFTDSTVVLSWLKTPTYLLQTWVASRVQKVLSATELKHWHHIKGSENPADLGSRGALPTVLKKHDLWWNGPPWAHLPINTWDLSTYLPVNELPELRPIALSLAVVKSNSNFITYTEKHSSYLRLVRVIAYIKRFRNNCSIPKASKNMRTIGPISMQEFSQASTHCLMLVQHHYFPSLYVNKSLNNLDAGIQRLNPFIDSEGLLRVGGRLANAPLPDTQKYPLLLPARSHLTKLVVEHFHRLNHHVGPTALLAIIRQTYWIPAARNLVRFVKHRCVQCVRYSKQTISPFMGSLPVARFQAARPFLHTGVDFAGPFMCRESRLRNSRVLKSYLCVFICLSTRAVHLEMALGLSVEDFLDTFDRFVARRGIPSVMYSDQGTNFVGASGYLKKVVEWFHERNNQNAFINHTSHLSVEWRFNPPLAPHFGGSWEAAVKSTKQIFYKAFGNQTFTSWELSSMFTKVESILNSRPLQPISDSPFDLETLTPGHFLIGQPLTTLPEPDYSDLPSNRLSRWELIRERVQFFWSRWKEEYISSLQPRNKWTKNHPNLKIGDVVLITNEDTPPSKWPLALIEDIHPGQDGTVRVVTVRTASGKFYKRPVVKLITLPV